MTEAKYKKIREKRIIALHVNCTLPDVDNMTDKEREDWLEEALDFKAMQEEIYLEQMAQQMQAEQQAPTLPRPFLFVPDTGQVH